MEDYELDLHLSITHAVYDFFPFLNLEEKYAT